MMQLPVGYSWTVTTGQISILVGIFLILAKLRGIDARFSRYLWEHDLMWADYAMKKGLPLTRGGKVYVGSEVHREPRNAE